MELEINKENILVVVVTYNGEKWIRDCMNSIDPGKGINGIVIDNGSTDKTLSIIRNDFPYIRIIETGKNLGFGQANNIGLKEAIKNHYNYVYLLNQDAWIEPDSLLKMAEIFSRNPEFGILSPLQIYKDSKKLDKDFSDAIPKELLDDLLLNPESLKELYESNYLAPAAHWMIKTDALKSIGGFSPTFSHFGEDDNMYDRAHFWGFKTGIVPGEKAIHDRESRPRDKRLALKLYNAGLRAKFSNPQKKVRPLNILHSFIKNFMLDPIETARITFSFMKDFSKIHKNRKETLKPMAFLK